MPRGKGFTQRDLNDAYMKRAPIEVRIQQILLYLGNPSNPSDAKNKLRDELNTTIARHDEELGQQH